MNMDALFEKYADTHLVQRVTFKEPFTAQVVYLATPYTLYADKDEASRAASYWQGRLGELGISSVAPIVMGHRMYNQWTHEQWMSWCLPMLRCCGAVAVPPIHGRESSRGIYQEVSFALSRNMPVFWG